VYDGAKSALIDVICCGYHTQIWDETKQAYAPRWGYKRGNDPSAEWAVEHKEGAGNLSFLCSIDHVRASIDDDGRGSIWCGSFCIKFALNLCVRKVTAGLLCSGLIRRACNWPDVTDPTVDPWTRMEQEKKERVAKNAMQRERNLKAAQGDRLPGDCHRHYCPGGSYAVCCGTICLRSHACCEDSASSV